MQNLSRVDQIRLRVARDSAVAARELDLITVTRDSLIAMVARLTITVEDLLGIIERGDQ